MTLRKCISLALVTTMLAGCNPPPPGAGQDTGGISKQDIGTVLGGVGGALIGSTMGGGNGRIATTAAGAILGGLAGSALGKSLDKADAAYANRNTQTALENGSTGQTMPWKNPDSGNSGSVTPQAPYKDPNSGQYCREFTQTIVVGGQKQQGYGTACRQQDGTWQIVSQQ
jgi:surface antigen